MFKNYLKTAIRNIRRNKTYATINTVGLAVGIASCLLIFLVIQFQTSFDNFHKNKDRIYRVGSVFTNDQGIDFSEATSFPVIDGIRNEFQDIKKSAVIYRTDGQITIDKSGSNEKFVEKNFFYAEPQFFQIFNFPLLQGNYSSLKDPHSALLTRSMAEQYFGDWKNAVGKSFTFKNKQLFTVAGILENPPANSDFPLGVVASYAANDEAKDRKEDWMSTFGGLNTYIVLPANITVENVNRRLVAFAKEHKPEDYKTDYYVLQPLSTIHFDERFGNYNRKTFSKTLLNALGLIGLFLLVIACVNFINLATAQAVNRAREVGVRKVLGGNRKQLINQFLSEISIIVFAACLAAILISTITLPFLNRLMEVQMSFNWFENGPLWIFLLLTFLITTILSGLYPAVMLSAFNPIKALKSKVAARSSGGINLRRGLVTFQFIIAQILVIAMLIVVSQLKYFRNASLGFDKASILNIRIPNDSLDQLKIDAFKNMLLDKPEIEDVSFSFAAPSSTSNWQSDFEFDHSGKKSNFSANLKWADPDYFKLYNLKFIAGEPYKNTDTVSGLVVNKTLLKKFGITEPQKALGKELNFWNGGLTGNIVGVIEDFNVSSLRDPISAIVMGPYKETYRTANIKILPGQEKLAIQSIENSWNELYPKEVFIYKFLDDTIANFYNTEDQLATLYKVFAAIALFISCLGLYGLVSFMSIQRTKEVGVRKVLGASSLNIIYLFSKEFTAIILIAFAISMPIAWYMMSRWLQNFSYRIEPGAWIYIATIGGSLFIAWITVGYRAVRAANSDPVKSLRSE